MSGTGVNLSDAKFQERFGGNAILVERGGSGFYKRPEKVDGQEASKKPKTDDIPPKITAFRCKDDIAVFGVEYVENRIERIMAWRFYDREKPNVDDVHCNESIDDIQLRFYELVEPQADCKLYVVGGTLDTTVGEGRLWDRIRKAIRGHFRPNVEVEKRENESGKNNRQYVTAKIEMDGKLTDCYHN